ncbi:MAG TPA: hypothetical protein VGK10_16220 [Prolixibacteraceae bacterium]
MALRLPALGWIPEGRGVDVWVSPVDRWREGDAAAIFKPAIQITDPEISPFDDSWLEWVRGTVVHWN